MRAKLISLAVTGLALAAIPIVGQPAAQAPASPAPVASPLAEHGQVLVAGKSTPYLIRHLPVSSFPALPAAVAEVLNQRGCTIPQTYEAHRPENVVHGSFQRKGSSDWAVLCSANGTVSLLVFLGAAGPGQVTPSVLVTAAETGRLQAHDPSGVLGFNWGIDAATPRQVHDVQAGLAPRPAPPDHDAVADSVVDRWTIYHLYSGSAWQVLEMNE
jgi:hypothetical protein